MSNRTVEYYEQNAVELSQRYETTALDSFHNALHAIIEPGAKIIEIGCGSGRDAARALAYGYDVIALDGSKNLLAEAARLHPELTKRLLHSKLPDKLAFANNSFAGFFSVACLMHFALPETMQILQEICRVVIPGGNGLVSLPTCRSDINTDGLDQHGRVFNVMPGNDWLKTFNECGFSAVAGPEEADSMGREGINWVTFFLTKKP